MTEVVAEGSPAVEAVFTSWVERFGAMMERGDIEALDLVFTPDGHWKDVLAFTWRYRAFEGLAEIGLALKATVEAVAPRGFRLAEGRTPPRRARRSARSVIEGYFDFDTAVGRGTGFARLIEPEGDDDALAWIVLTTLHELRGFEERLGERRPSGLDHSTTFAGPNWLDQRDATQAYADRDPEVLVIGAGQAGLALAARLGQMGVDTLLVERNPRVGDNWRQRYHSLTLHNEVWTNSLPYLPFPDTWPTFVPKDKLAGWLEGYAEAMELNVWTATELVGATYDEATRRWTASVRGADGTERTLVVPHLVMATGGVSGTPYVPQLPGLEDFAGEVLHSSRFTSSEPHAGRSAIVVGTGNSGHDVAQELHGNGAARVTMVQRSPTCVVSLVPSGTMVYALYSEGPPADDIDLITAAIPYRVLQESYQWLTQKTCEMDRDLLDRLAAVGFRTDFGVDRTGFHMMYLRNGGGYYINVGCSDLIADGEIGLVQAADIDTFVADGLRLADGAVVPADMVVLATGYENQQQQVRTLLGDEVADLVGPVWGFDEHHNMRNMWQQTAQPGLWFMGGSLMDCRLHSRFLALQIKAELEGLLPPAGAGPVP
jgi:cation diffusion facilitator CzcD-associated flavoprotein CzcO